jgi:RNA polymerase sigma factor (sigma-70 family)
MSEPAIIDLIESCKKNDERARSKLFSMFSPKVMGVCRRYTYSKYEAEDILQEAFINIFKGLHQFNGEKGSFGGWIYKITVNTALKYISRNMKEKFIISIEESHQLMTDSVYVDDSINEYELLRMLDELPIGKKTIFNLYAIEGFSHKEIAAKLNISEATSRSQFTRAKEKLAQLHKKYYSIA